MLRPKLWLLLCAAILQGCMAADVGRKSGGEANENIYLDCEVDAAQLMEIEAEVYGDVPSDLAFFKHADPRYDGRHFMNSDRRGCYWNFVGESFYVSTTKREFKTKVFELRPFMFYDEAQAFYKTRNWRLRRDWFIKSTHSEIGNSQRKYLFIFASKRFVLDDSYVKQIR